MTRPNLRHCMKRVAIFFLNYIKLFLMPFLLLAFIGGCLYRAGKTCIQRIV